MVVMTTSNEDRMMEIRPIETEADYDAALAEIAQLINAEPETPE